MIVTSAVAPYGPTKRSCFSTAVIKTATRRPPRRYGVGTVTERTSAVELFRDPGHGDQCDGGGDDIELHVAQPRQVLQMGIAHKIYCHQTNNDLVHGRLLQQLVLLSYPLNRRGRAFCNGHFAEVQTTSHLNC